MGDSMSISKTFFLGVAVLSLCACQTTSTIRPPSETLLAGIEPAADTQIGATKLLNATDPTCVTFYKNTAAFVAQPADFGAGAPATPSFGGSLMKTFVLGTLAGVASGGVAAIGISNSFAEAALIGTASQVTYNTGGSIYDKIVTPKPDPEAEAEAQALAALDPMQEIRKAAAVLGCPAPDQASIAALNLGKDK